MSLSNELISQFVKTTVEEQKNSKEAIVYGTTVEVDGVMWVKLDGSEILTPVSTTTDVKAGERVTVMIKDHSATVTGNISSPSARTEDVKEIGGRVDSAEGAVKNLEADNLIVKGLVEAAEAEIKNIKADMITTDKLEATEARIDDLEADMVTTDILESTYAKIEELDAVDAKVNNLDSTYATIENVQATYATVKNLEAAEARIDTLESDKITTDALDAKYATIENVKATYATVKNLNAATADIENLKTDKLDATTANATYASIDFANIGAAAIEKIFGDSGIIKDLVVGDQTITGELVGVTISGDLIKGNTIMADKLVIKGDDGIYYKLNINALGETAANALPADEQEALKNGLHGSNIIAKTITAEKVSVSDLVAFGATIGGFNITKDAIYSGVKSAVDNTTVGTYFGKDGQFAIGDSSNYLKFYATSDGTYLLELSANTVKFGAEGQSVESAISDNNDRIGDTETSIDALNDTTDDLGTRVGNAEESIGGLNEKNTELEGSLENANTAIGEVRDEVDTVREDLNGFVLQLEELKKIAGYVRIGTYGDEPCIELGNGESDFKVIITNTQILFKEGSDTPAYVNNKSLYINKAVIEEDLEQGGFVWKARSNGNLGLVWKGGNS